MFSISAPSRIRVDNPARKLLLPLPQHQIDQTVALATRPADRLILALTAVHAVRGYTMRRLQLDDVDLGNRVLTAAGRTRPLDDLTYRLLVEWLGHRRSRWPNTANPHLLINRMSALTLAPVSKEWTETAFRGQAATLEKLRADRQLEEALAHGPDPLHLAVVFGLDEGTAVRYAAAARQLIETAIESDRDCSTSLPT